MKSELLSGLIRDNNQTDVQSVMLKIEGLNGSLFNISMWKSRIPLMDLHGVFWKGLQEIIEKKESTNVQSLLLSTFTVFKKMYYQANDLLKVKEYGELIDKWQQFFFECIKVYATFKCLKLTQYICEFITEIYSDYEIDKQKNVLILNNRTLFQELGDKALVCDGNVEEALLWYNLILLNWEGFKIEYNYDRSSLSGLLEMHYLEKEPQIFYDTQMVLMIS